ncbi:MAG TPA: cytochrome c peroxidase [Polyangiaceae bacterium]|nr:cytochrome c peroxidase [Polyangiaceae bacterium]
MDHAAPSAEASTPSSSDGAAVPDAAKGKGPSSSDAAADAGDDPDPVFTTATRNTLMAMALSSLPPAPSDVTNKWADDAAAARFGQKLFFDTSFSGKLLDGDNDGSSHALGVAGDTGKVACAGCHQPAAGFADARSLGGQISLGAGWVIHHTPSLLDVSRSRLITWTGRHDALYNQPFGPLESAVEMNSSRLFVAEQMFALHRADYEAVFGAMPPLDDAQRFPQLTADQTGCAMLDSTNACATKMHGVPGDGAEYDGLAAADQDAVTRVVVNMGKALGAYERLITCGTSAFDRFMQGDTTALARDAQRGAILFATKGQCIHCHEGPFFSDEKFHNVGLEPTVVATVFIDTDDPGAAQGIADLLADPLNTKGEYSDGDDGRLPSSVVPSDSGAFRTPRLRCGSKRPAFMHTGQFKTLAAVVSFFARGGDPFGYPGTSEIAALDLSAREQADLVAFLESLDGAGPPGSLLGPPQ